jgi:uncharacterized protein involved in exopolysaccharide biosynthesis
MSQEDFAIEKYHRPSLPTLRDVAAVIFRQRWVVVTTFLLTIAAIAATGFWKPKFDAQMKILVRRQRPDTLVAPGANAQTAPINDQVTEEDINSEVELLNSQDLLRKVVVETGLADGLYPGRDSDVQIAKAVRKLGKDLKIEPLRKSNVISVHYSASNPWLANRVLTALSNAYTEKHLQVHRSSGELKFFDQQMEQYQKGLAQAQNKLDAFRKSTGVVSAEQERDSALKDENDFDAAARQAQSSLEEARRRIDALTAELNHLEPRTVTVVRTADNSQLLEQLKSTLLTLQLKRTELLTKYSPTYRPVQEVEEQITETKNAIAAAESKPIREQSTDQNPNYQWVRAELTKAEADLPGLRARSDSAAEIAAHYHQVAQQLSGQQVVQQDLQRVAKTQEDNYFLYVQKREEARISEALDERGILDVALAEQPVVPALPDNSPLKIALVTLLLAATLSLAAGVTKDLADPSFRTPDELANYLGVPVLASLPKPGKLALPMGES